MDDKQKADKTSKITISKLRLNSLVNVKKSLARLANEILKADVENGDVTRLRGTAYVLNILVAAYRLDFENRLEALENIMSEKR